MKKRILSSHHISLVSLAVLATACGGKVGGGEDERLEWATYLCGGQLQGPGLPATGVVLGNAVDELTLCSPTSKTDQERQTECKTQCDAQLGQYATDLGLSADQAAALSCSIARADRQAVNSPDCNKNTGPQPLQDELLAEPIDSRYLQGGFAQYVATLNGDVDVEVHVDFFSNPTADSAVHGTVGYVILPPTGLCPAAGCQLIFTHIDLRVDDFDIGLPIGPFEVASHSIRNLRIRNDGPVVASIDDAGSFNIPSGSAEFFLNLTDDGVHNSGTKANPKAISGTINRASGTLAVNNVEIVDDDTDFDISDVSGSVVASPPTAVITPPSSPVECNAANGAQASYSAAGTSDPDGHPIAAYYWQIDGQSAGTGVDASGFFPLGASTLRVVALDSTFAGGVTTAGVTVVDTTNPTIPALPQFTATLCDPTAESTNVPIPAASDICDPDVTITGQVIESNGQVLATPTSLVGGSVQIGIGSHVIRWTVTDDSGNSSTAVQAVQVRPAIYATDGVSIGDEAVVRVNDSVLAAIANTGNANLLGLDHRLNVGDEARVGDLFSRAAVFLDRNAFVDGNITTSSIIIRRPGAVVTGTQQTGVSSIPLPPPLDLSGVDFPDLDHEPYIRVDDDETRALAPGAYSTISVDREGILQLAAGTYFTKHLRLDRGSRVELDGTGSGVRMFVSHTVEYEGEVVTVAGDPMAFVLGFKGHGLIAIESVFNGTLIAPEATAFVEGRTFGNQPTGFNGRLFAERIKLDDEGVITCVSPNTAVVGGLSAPATATQRIVLNSTFPTRKLERVQTDNDAEAGSCSARGAGAPATGFLGMIPACVGLWFARRRLLRSKRRA